MRHSLILPSLLLLSLTRAQPARACTPLGSPPAAIPRDGAENVSVASSLILQSSFPFELRTGEEVVPLVSVAESPGIFSEKPGRIQVASPQEFLKANTTYTIYARQTAGQPLAPISTFTTGGESSKETGTSPQLESFRLWKVRYPTHEINSGNCVFAEYISFIQATWKPGSVPRTDPSSLVHTLRLSPKNGGTSQPFVVVGDTTTLGEEPAGLHPSPIAPWHPEVGFSGEYCLTIEVQGDGDRERPPLEGNQLCTCVELRGAGDASPPSGNGCGTAGAAGISGAGAAGGSSQADAPRSADVSGGCQAASGRTDSPLGALLLAGGIALGRRRRIPPWRRGAP